MRAAAKNLDLRQRQRLRIGAAEIAIQRLAGGSRSSVGDRHGHGDNGIAAEARLARSAIQVDQPTIERRLIGRVHADSGAAISPFTCATARVTS